MSEKKQDQLIRETFDQYRTGIGSMPSQRAQIIYRLGEKPAANTRLYYRIAAVAAALVLLLGIGLPVLSGNGFLTGHPDQVRTTGDLADVRPEPTGFVPLAQPEGTPETSAQPEPEASLNYRSRIDTVDPDLVDALVPVNLSYEKSGIRLNVLEGAVRENEALLIYSVQDTEGERINELTVDQVFPGMTGYDSYSSVLHEYDVENHRITAGMVIRYDDLESCLKESAIPLDMMYLEVCSRATAEYEQPRREVIIPGLVQLPELMDYCIRSGNDGKREYYTTEDYRALGRKVIDYSRPEGLPVSDHVLLSHAEAYGSEFHVQLQYTDWAYWPLLDAKVALLDKEDHETTPGWDGHMRWDTDGDGDPDFEEFVFPIDPKGTGPIRFRVDIVETREVLEDSWEVKIPLESIRKEQGEVTAE